MLGTEPRVSGGRKVVHVCLQNRIKEAMFGFILIIILSSTKMF